jgi:hypothetical protein
MFVELSLMELHTEKLFCTAPVLPGLLGAPMNVYVALSTFIQSDVNCV